MLRAASEGEQLASQVRGPTSREQDAASVLPRAGAGLPFQRDQLREAHDGGKLIIEVVGHPARELTDGVQLLRLAQTLFERQPLLFAAASLADVTKHALAAHQRAA